MKRLGTATIGACGEHYVAAYLSRKELVVALPRAGVPGTDLFVAKDDGHPIRVQVKTGTQATRKDKVEGPIYLWSTAANVANLIDDKMWFAFVWLRNWPHEDELPEVFFVPLSAVAKCMKGEQEASWPYFWMRVVDAGQYKGDIGFKKLEAALSGGLTGSGSV